MRELMHLISFCYTAKSIFVSQIVKLLLKWVGWLPCKNVAAMLNNDDNGWTAKACGPKT